MRFETLLALTLALVAFAPAARAEDAKEPAAAAKAGKAPKIDGTFQEEEWEDATKLERGRGDIYLKHDERKVYIAFVGEQGGIASVFVKLGGKIKVLHASASLGTAVYKPAADGKQWELERGFKWRKDADGCWKDEGWRGSLMQHGDRTHMEFALDLSKFMPRSPKKGEPAALTVALVHGGLGPSLLRWPGHLDDGTKNSKLLMGHTPAPLSFSAKKWGRLTLVKAKREKQPPPSTTEKG